MESLNRREFMKKALGMGAAIVLNSVSSKNAEAREKSYQFLTSNLTPEILESQKQRSINSLIASIPPNQHNQNLDYLRENARDLPDESQMYIPSIDELQEVTEKSELRLQELASHIEAGSYGLFVFADADEHANRFQRLYVVQKHSNGTDVQFVKAYLVSVSGNGFGDKKDSGQTPLGMHWVRSGKRGMFGEVVSVLNKYKDMFNRVVDKDGEHWFVKGFGKRDGGNDIAEVVTDRYTIDEKRAIHLHGTNRSGWRDKLTGMWRTLLGGTARSGGCIRLSNVDIRDLGLSGYIWWPDKSTKERGTPVMVHATPAAIEKAGEFSDTEMQLRPPRWKPPNDNAHQPEQEPPLVRKRPPRWKPKTEH